MAEGHGGYRQPANPAPVSGPGPMSQRTDGGPGDPQPQRWVPTSDYGGATEMQEVQQGAPMAGQMQAVPLDAPTQRPDEPITAGAPFGPGPGPREAGPDPANVPAPEAVDAVAATIRAAYAAYPSPQLAAMMDYLESQGR